MRSPLYAVFRALGARWRDLLGFAILFRIIESALFAPGAALVGKWLLGRTVLDSTAIVSFVLSPRGLLSLTFAAVVGLSIRLLEHAGLSAIFFGALEGRRVNPRQAFRSVRGRMLQLVRVAARIFAWGMVCAAPLLLVTGAFAAWLLPKHDINYYLKLRPPEFLLAAVVILLVGLGTLGVLLWWVTRWRWVIQVLLFERTKVADAFERSVELTRGQRGRLAVFTLAVAGTSVALGLLASVVGTACANLIVGATGRGIASLAMSFGLLLFFRTCIGTVCTLLGSCLDAGLFTALYWEQPRQEHALATTANPEAACDSGSPRWLPAAFAAGLLVITTTGAWFALGALDEERVVAVHAHRGVSGQAAENTWPAFRAAMSAGADYLETDVQLSKDGVLVLAHDSDFSRLGGVAKKVWDLTYDEIRAIPLGRGLAPPFSNEVTPTLESLLGEARGRIRLNLELKYYGDHQPGLAAKVVEALRAQGMLDQVIIQCLEYEPLQEVRRLAPELPIGYLLSVNARAPARLEVNFLSVEQTRVDRKLLMTAHQRGQQVYAWTVNRAPDMERLLDMGIDGLITDESALARRTIDDYHQRPQLERAARRVKAWLAD